MPLDDSPTPLFSSYDLDAWLARRRENLQVEIDGFEAGRILDTPRDAMLDYLLSVHSVEPLVVHAQDWSTDTEGDQPVLGEAPDGQPAHRLEIHVPFEGDSELLQVRVPGVSPSRSVCTVGPRSLVIEIWIKRGAEPHARVTIERTLADMERAAVRIHDNVLRFNEALSGVASGLLDARREALLAHRELVAALGLDLRHRRTHTPYGYTARQRLELPRLAEDHSSEAVATRLSEAALDAVGLTLRHALHQLRYSPQVFADMDESDVRDHCVVGLNAALEVQGSKSVFAAKGRRGLVLEAQGRPLFAVRLGLWSDAAALRYHLDRLLAADASHMALVMLAPWRQTASTLEAVKAGLMSHPDFTGLIDARPGTDAVAGLGKAKGDAALRILMLEQPKGSSRVTSRKARRATPTGEDQMGFGF
ncbi:hypothetical protein [Pseudomonas sp. Marseille-QA0892]